jgi:CHASE2 domain-containing sensor protein
VHFSFFMAFYGQKPRIRRDVKGKTVRQATLLKSALGAALAVFCGLLLWQSPLGEPWVNASYDYLFRFGAHTVTNNVAVILMDNEAFDQFHQTRGQPWDRALHAQLLNRLADDGCALVVFDSFFRSPRNAVSDKALADAMRRQRVVLMAEQAQVTHPDLSGAQPTLPAEGFLDAAGTNWGVAWLDPDLDQIVRRHWPFPSPGTYPSLPETIARLAGAHLGGEPQERWLRYYGQEGAWTKLSYRFALTQPAGYFRNKIIFIGTQPQTTLPDGEPDKFRTPYTRWTGECSGGVEIIITSFLNLVNGNWLRRPAGWIELSTLVVSGILIGGGLCRMKLPTACAYAAALAVIVALGAISCSYFTNYWFPWLVISGGQVPCALACALAVSKTFRGAETKADAVDESPVIPGYELIHPPFGRGAYGKVWLAKNKAGQWRALKIIFLANFENDSAPYEREFQGISRYKPVSEKHPGLLRVDFVSKKLDGYFYYVMELGDSIEPDWEREPSKYKPRDLGNERARAEGKRLPVPQCVQIGIELAGALEFLHQQGLTHRDIKPSNIIFVDGRPKLADLGLIAEIRPPDHERTVVGTPGYMPPLPERPGTPASDIYSLGVVLYVLSTGRAAAYFPEIATSLVANKPPLEFFPLNNVILKACQQDAAQRHASAAEMRRALQELQKPPR